MVTYLDNLKLKVTYTANVTLILYSQAHSAGICLAIIMQT